MRSGFSGLKLLPWEHSLPRGKAPSFRSRVPQGRSIPSRLSGRRPRTAWFHRTFLFSAQKERENQRFLLRDLSTFAKERSLSRIASSWRSLFGNNRVPSAGHALFRRRSKAENE